MCPFSSQNLPVQLYRGTESGAVYGDHTIWSDYEGERETFSWGDIYAEADWDAPGELNIAHESPTDTPASARRSRSIRSTPTENSRR